MAVGVAVEALLKQSWTVRHLASGVGRMHWVLSSTRHNSRSGVFLEVSKGSREAGFLLKSLRGDEVVVFPTPGLVGHRVR